LKRDNNAKKIINLVQVNIPFRMLYEDFLDLFVEFGLNPEIGLDAHALDNYSSLDFKKIISPFHKNERRITVHGPFLDLSPGSSDPAIRDITRRRLEQVLALVPILKPKTVVCHAGYEEDRYSYFYESWLGKSLEMWRWFGEKLLEAGTVLMLENVYEKKPAEILPFLSRLQNLNVGFCFDLGHQFAFGKASLDSWIDMLGPYIGQLHLHDNNGSKDEHLPLGKGKIDFYPLIGFLKKRKELPLITLEPHEEADLWPSMEYLSRMLDVLGME
jgi:sugar phosphate isomerase/epimerase